jgi:hypothetical protein
MEHLVQFHDLYRTREIGVEMALIVTVGIHGQCANGCELSGVPVEYDAEPTERTRTTDVCNCDAMPVGAVTPNKERSLPRRRADE